MKLIHVSLVTSFLLFTACGSKKAASTTDGLTKNSDRGGSSSRANGEKGGTVKTAANDADFSPIYFELDSDELTTESRDKLDTMARFLVANNEVVTVEGHCDERGTTEYNLALGDRRARVIRDYLTRLGVSTQRLKVISYGEERPAVQGKSEDAWTQNRRGAFQRTN